MYSVEPPNKGHVEVNNYEFSSFDLCACGEVVLFSEVLVAIGRVIIIFMASQSASF